MAKDYKNTVFLPTTDFPMKAGLPRREPEMLERWDRMDLRGKLRADAVGRPPFVLHDGPPYANGHLHIGHALNKILKDMIVRSRRMMGFDANYVPGWDCHGLPIEWKIEEKYRRKGKDKDQVPIIQFRDECRTFAAEWIDIQRAEFKRLGVEGDWDNPYATMTFPAETRIVRELGGFLMDGSLYRGAKPVLWSVVEKTALAEAEVEYHDHVSTTVFVRFNVVETQCEAAKGASIVVWTTTPWTMPGNRAVAFGADIDYVALTVEAVADGSLAKPGEMIVVAESLAAAVALAAGIESHSIAGRLKGKELEGSICRHPLRGGGYDFDVPALAADFVEVDTGSGFVHIAPGHGRDDWELGVANGVAVPETVGGDGLYLDHVPMFAGSHVFKADPIVVEALRDAGGLLASGALNHQYPHSWRSKAPLIFRNTAQWFISMEANGLRDKALSAIGKTAFHPESGRKRLSGMIEVRPDWCVSRQRAWGVPITVFVHKETGEPLRDQAVLDRIAAIVEKEGADAWFTRDPSDFLGADHAVDEYEQVMDILDVWFDSGCTHGFVLEDRDDLSWPADLYLEGSDQHRGWFQSSLLESCGTRGGAPYKGVLTHGFVMREDGQKMSKSLGNIVSPQDVTNRFGADILRLWVVASDYSDDLRIGAEILKRHADVYRRLRNTLRYVLGNLNGFQESEKLPVSEMPELERWVLGRLKDMDDKLRNACETFDFQPFFSDLHNFCAADLSAFYFDIRKDAIYCDAFGSMRRRAARTVLDQIFNALTAWLAPFLCFTAEEAWLARNPGDDESVHLRRFPDIPEDWRDDGLDAKWTIIRDLRRVVTGALELERKEKRIGSSLQAHPKLHAPAEMLSATDGLDMAETCITSGIDLIAGPVPAEAFVLEDVPDVGVVPGLAVGERCERCWRVLNEVGDNADHPTLCKRCAAVVDSIPRAAE